MKKSILTILAIIVVVIAAGVFYVLTNLDSLVKAAIEKHGSEAVKTSVQVSSVAIKLGDGAASIKGLTVANPNGFSLPLAFSLGEITVDLDLENTSEKLIAIDSINVGAPQIFYEINAERKDNLSALKDNLELKPSASPEPATKSPPTGPIKLSIKRFVLDGAVIKAKIIPLKDKEYDLKIPTLRLANLKGAPEEIARQVLNQLIDHAKKEIRKKGLDKELAEMKAKAKARAKAKVDQAKSELKKKAEDKLDEQKQKLGDKLKNLSW
jgi:hypothetical protein